MTTPKDVKSARPLRIDLEPTDPEPVDVGVPEMDTSATGGRLPLGRIVHDDRGNAVWKWRGETSATSDTTSGVLKHIDPVDLRVEGQGGGPARPGGTRTPVPDAGGGYDPYDQGQPGNKR